MLVARPQLTQENLVKWLEQLPPDEEYDYWSITKGCLLQRFAYAMGYVEEDYSYGKMFGGKDGLDAVVACPMPRTNGAALARAKRAQPSPL